MDTNKKPAPGQKKRILAQIPEKVEEEPPPVKKAPATGAKASKVDYAKVAKEIIDHFQVAHDSFTKKEIVSYCEESGIDMGNWGSLLKYLYKGDGANRMENIVNRGPYSAYKIAEGGQDKPPVKAKRGRNKGSIDYADLTDRLIKFINSLLDKEVSKAEILRYFEDEDLNTGNWITFTKYMKEGNARFSVITNGLSGKKCRYILEPKGGAAASIEKKTPIVPAPKKVTLPKPQPKPLKTPKVSSEAAPKTQATTLKIAEGEKVSITIKIEIG